MKGTTSRSAALVAAATLLFLAAPGCSKKSGADKAPASDSSAAETTTAAPGAGAPEATAQQPDSQKVSLVVVDFQVGGGSSGELAERVSAAIARTHKFRLLERSRIEDVLREHDLTRQGLTDPAYAVKAGKMIGADFLLFGKLTERGANTVENQIPHTQHVERRTIAQVGGRFRVVDTRSGEIVASREISVSRSSESMGPGGYESGSRGDLLAGLDDAFAERLAQELVGQVYPIKVASVSGSQIVLNRGEGGGLRPGQRIEIISLGKAIVDPDTGDVLDHSESRIATARVDAVRARVSEATVEGTAAVEVGMIARPLSGGARSAAATVAADPAEDQRREENKPKW